MPIYFHVDIVSSEAEIYSGSAQGLIVPGIEGELGIYARHAPLLTLLKPGLVRLLKNDADEETFFISGGILEAQPDTATVLADTVLRSKELDEAAARTAQGRIEERMKRALSEEDYARLKAELAFETALLRSIERLHRKHTA